MPSYRYTDLTGGALEFESLDEMLDQLEEDAVTALDGKCPECRREFHTRITHGLVQLSCDRCDGRGISSRLTREHRATFSGKPIIGKPVIVVNGGYLDHDVVDSAAWALAELNKYRPEIFQHGDDLVTVTPEGRLKVLEGLQLQIRMTEAATFRDRVQTDVIMIGSNPGTQLNGRNIDPPGRTANAVSTEVDRFAKLERIVTVPVLLSNGNVNTTPGYIASERLFYLPSVEDITIPGDVTQKQLDSAVSLIRDDLLGDFPFADQSSRANAFAGVLQTFVRNMILGPTPIYWVTAPAAGTGKGLLVDLMLAPGAGEVASSLFPGGENEVRKNISTAMKDGDVAVKWDNARGTITSAALELATTEGSYRDRQLGSNVAIGAPIRCMWTVTCNNATAGGDLWRRILPIKLDSGLEFPSARGGPRPGQTWRHVNVWSWALEHRRELIEACLVICRWWGQNSQPVRTSDVIFGSYEAWLDVMGGILEAAGVSGLAGNLGAAQAQNVEHEGRTALLQTLRDTFGSRWFSSAEADAVPQVVALLDGKRAAYVFRGLSDTIAGGLVLRHNRRLWHVESIGSE
jgi:hypothetical protein